MSESQRLASSAWFFSILGFTLLDFVKSIQPQWLHTTDKTDATTLGFANEQTEDAKVDAQTR